MVPPFEDGSDGGIDGSATGVTGDAGSLGIDGVGAGVGSAGIGLGVGVGVGAGVGSGIGDEGGVGIGFGSGIGDGVGDGVGFIGFGLLLSIRQYLLLTICLDHVKTPNIEKCTKTIIYAEITLSSLGEFIKTSTLPSG